MSSVNFDFSDFKDFFERLRKASSGDFKKEISTWFESLGIDLLKVVEDEIMRRDVTDTRKLLHSFTKGDANNVWEISDGGLTLEIGTHIHYASYVNDGHWTNPKGVSIRFVPGVWNGNKFEYIPGSKTGMVLKQKWVEGKHYWESAMHIWEKMFPEMVEAKLQQWIDDYFGL